MDDYNILVLLRNLFLTAASYLIFPLVFSRINKGKKTYSKKKLILIAIANALVVKIIFIVISYPNVGSFSPTYLWGWVGYEILISKLLEETQNETDASNDSTVKTAAEQPMLEIPTTHSPVDEKVKVKVKLKTTKQEKGIAEQPAEIETKQTKRSFILPPALLYTITVISVCASIFLFVSNTELKTQLNKSNTSLEHLRESHSELINTNQDLEYDLNKLKENYNDYEMAYYFAVKHVKLYVNGEYHSFGCSKIKTYGASSYTVVKDTASFNNSSCFCNRFANIDRKSLDSEYRYIIP